MPYASSILQRKFGLGQQYDPDALSYFSTAGITDSTAKQNINSFVKNVKGLGIWSSMVCWPLRSTQNQSTTGTSVYSLGGLGSYTGTRVGASSWLSTGLNLSNNGLGTNNQYITLPPSLCTSGLNQFAMGVFNANSNTNFNQLVRIDDSTATGRNPFLVQSYAALFNVSFNLPNSGSTVASPTFTSAISVGSFNALIGSKVGTSVTVCLNASNTLTNTATQSAFSLPSSTSYSALGFYTDGVVPFAMIGRFDASSTLVSQIYSLYKSTLGQGIALP